MGTGTLPEPPGTQDEVFDEFVETYEGACAKGLALSGESRDYFLRERIGHTKAFCGGRTIRSIVDFGCGMGHSAPLLAEAFPQSKVLGIDTSTKALQWASDRYSEPRIRFATTMDDHRKGSVDLVYSNGTFHHIDPAARPAVIREIYSWLAPGGFFMLWENNPWNPGTRLVMRRIPFDRDAKTLSYLNARRILYAGGFDVRTVSFHFYFPSFLRVLRPLEGLLTRLPLGAQYCAVARRPA